MHLLINISNNLAGGGLQVALSFLNECKKIKDNFYSVAILEKNCHLIKYEKFPENFKFYIISYKYLFDIKWKMKSIERTIKPDVVFTVFGPSYWTPIAPHIMGYAIPHYIYPESPFYNICPQVQKFKIHIKKWIHLSLIKLEANCLITETEDASMRLKKILKIKKMNYEIVSNTCSDFFQKYTEKITGNTILPERLNDEFRFLYLTKYYLHKNIEIIPKILDLLRDDVVHDIKFILTIDTNIYKKIIPEKYRKNIINIGFVPMKDTPQLYSEVDAVFQPSYLEVFSANYVEAMKMKKPILASNFSFAHDICGNAACYFNPLSLTESKNKIIDFVNDKELQKNLIINGSNRLKQFPTSEERAKKYIEICARYVKNNKLL